MLRLQNQLYSPCWLVLKTDSKVGWKPLPFGGLHFIQYFFIDGLTSGDWRDFCIMENTDADDWASKTEDKDPPPSPYSLETPYGFHLDLDFLKYVDDIEKGNTIKRIPIHRKTKHPKFSTLPRNFSLPENGSKAYSFSSDKSFLSHRKASLGAEESNVPITYPDLSPFPPIQNEASYRRKAFLIEAVKQDGPVCLEEQTGTGRGRPQLLRASSMPATLPPTPSLEEEIPFTFLQSPDPKGLEFDFSPAKESLESDSFKGTSLATPDNMRNMKQQISKTTHEVKRERTQIVLDPKQTMKGRMHLSSSWDGQPLISQELLMVAESREEEEDTGEANICLVSDQSQATSSRVLDCKPESQIQKEIELSICETVTELPEEEKVTRTAIRETEEKLNLETLPSEEPNKIIALKQHIAILEEELNNKTEELEQIRVVLKQQDREIKAKERSIEMLANSKAQLEEKLCGKSTKEIKACMQAKNIPQYHDAAVNTELAHDKIAKKAHDKEVNVSLTVPVECVGCSVSEDDNKNPQAKEVKRKLVHGPPMSSLSVGFQGRNSLPFQKQKEVEDERCILDQGYNELKINEYVDNGNNQEVYNCGVQFSVATGDGRSGVEAVDSKAGGNQHAFQQDFKQELDEEEGHPEQKKSPMDPTVGQYVKKIQDLLQEQWMCLEHGYPELASAIKQPASKLSSIQNQLVNSLNVLLSAYSAPTDKANSNTQYQQLEISPSTSLKSIMKKKDTGVHAGGNGTKKNLQFVGVNGGYETTSSEDSSCEESSSDQDSDSETERRCGSEEHRWGDNENGREKTASGTSPGVNKEDAHLEELEGSTRSNIQHKTERFQPSPDFLKGCQILSKHLVEIRTTKDKLLRHVLSTICQEWFRISSRKSSGPETVAVYLQEVKAIHPQLQNVIVNLADGNGNTALHYSVSHSNFRIVKILLETGVCDVDHQNKAGYTAVMITPLASAETDEEMEVVKKLLKEGNVNIRASQGGQTALILGVSHDREDMVKALLSCGADINLQDDSGLSPLMVASQYGNIEIVKLLLAHPGCDATLTDKAGNSALSLALKSAHTEIAECLQTHIQHTRPLNT